MNLPGNVEVAETSDPYLYDFIPVRMDNAQEPTFLYGLEPIGIGTPLVESLSSYLARLAAAHMLPVSALLRHVIADYLPKDNHNLGKQIGPQAIIKNMNGMGAASNMVDVLEELTGRTNLANLTMMPFSRLISPYKLMSSTSSWCSYCLEERKAMEQPVYFPLLWSLRESKKCPVHRCYLRFACPHCNAVSPVLASRTVMGYCHRCNGWLGSELKGEPSADYSGNYKFFVRLFEWQYTVECKREQSTFPSMLQYLMGNKLRRNCVEALASNLHIHDSILHELLSGKMLPTLGVVFRISKVFKVNPMDVLTTSGEEMARRDAEKIVKIDSAVFNPAKVKWTQLNELLRDVASGKASSMCVEDIAKVYKCLPEEITSRYPEVCSEVTKRFNRLIQLTGNNCMTC